MIEITSFLLKHLYELMADNYNATQRDSGAARAHQTAANYRDHHGSDDDDDDDHDDDHDDHHHDDHHDHQVHGDTNDDDDEDEDRGGPGDGDEGRRTGVEARSAQSESQRRDCDHGPGAKLAATSGRAQAEAQAARDESSHATDDNQSAPRSALAFVRRRLGYHCRRQLGASRSARHSRSLLAREQETNQQIVAFLINNQLPDLVCETVIELIFISVFLAVSWIFVMIIQLHCHQPGATLPAEPSDSATPTAAAMGQLNSYKSARQFYCNTRFLNSLMYCNNQAAKLYSS